MSSPGEVGHDSLEKQANRTRYVLFGLLIIATVIPLFVPIRVPEKPTKATVDLYKTLMATPDGSTVLLQTDWTISTRGESGGEFDAVARILMRKNCKFVIYSTGDPQAPRVAKDEIMNLNEERKKNGERPYQQWNDYINVGYFPNAEGATAGMAADLHGAWGGRKDVNAQGQPEDIFDSPVLKGITSVTKVPLIAVVTPSNTFNILIERLSGKVPIVASVTGVMGPESYVYYASSQIQGLASGLQGVYDLETMMQYGINEPGPGGSAPMVQVPGYAQVPGFPDRKDNFGRGALYYPTLHVDLTLMMLAVVVGNILMFASRRRNAQ